MIHGAWAGAWVWDGLIKELRKLGRDAEALDLPGDGFHPISAASATENDFHHCLTSAIHARPGPVVLAGHSGGGMLVTAAANAHPDKVTHGIWIAGFLIPDGRTYDEIQQQVPQSHKVRGAMDYVTYSADGSTTTIPQQAAIKLFFQDVPQASLAAARLTPQPVCGARIRTPTSERFQALPKLYIHAQQDNSVLPPTQLAMAASTDNVTVHNIATGHAPQLTRACELARVMDYWLQTNATSVQAQ